MRIASARGGATIIAEPADQFYGDRTYRARDPEGHNWTFAQPVRAVTREEAERASGYKIEGWARKIDSTNDPRPIVTSVWQQHLYDRPATGVDGPATGSVQFEFRVWPIFPVQ